MSSAIVGGMFTAFLQLRPFRFAFFSTAWGLLVLGSFLLFSGLVGDDSDRGQVELACTKEKLEAMWGMPLPADLEVVGSIPKSGVASTGWDITELGCSGTIHPTATLKLRE
jgi:hypothetical protein